VPSPEYRAYNYYNMRPYNPEYASDPDPRIGGSFRHNIDE
jgi:hypothetical protein